MDGGAVEVLRSPAAFYDALLEGVRGAESTVTLASLYLGNGPKEQKR